MTENTESWRKPDLSDEENAELDAWEAEVDSPAFKHGHEVGYALGLYAAEKEAIAAFEAGEIELWIDMARPKSMEEWDAWNVKYGSIESFRSRWS